MIAVAASCLLSFFSLSKNRENPHFIFQKNKRNTHFFSTEILVKEHNPLSSPFVEQERKPFYEINLHTFGLPHRAHRVAAAQVAQSNFIFECTCCFSPCDALFVKLPTRNGMEQNERKKV